LCFHLEEITKFCKLLAKKNVDLDYTGPQLIDFVGIVEKYNQLYNKKFTEYASRNSALPQIPQKRKREDTMLVEAPTDPVERLNFFLVEASKLAKCDITAPIASNASSSFAVSSGVKIIMNYKNAPYKLLGIDMLILEEFAFMTLKKEDLEEKAKTIATFFIDSVVKFDDVEICITSGDIFIHNHLSIDNCAYGLGSIEVYQHPVAKIKSLSYMGSNTYYELSIYCGFVELLAIGGFYISE
ncbi:hypothetical protein ABG067_007880, partial [Albugo candida]